MHSNLMITNHDTTLCSVKHVLNAFTDMVSHWLGGATR